MKQLLAEIKEAEKEAHAIIERAEQEKAESLAKVREAVTQFEAEEKAKLEKKSQRSLDRLKSDLEKSSSEMVAETRKDIAEFEAKAKKSHKKAVDLVLNAFEETIKG
ncbi:TPA: hypothetical protein HA361_02300 [Candidatus Woesearchaeota archaeon]|nr:hypothetical protein [Candidatus Woesearchaeota archaeon]